jgi:hypothetical protein
MFWVLVSASVLTVSRARRGGKGSNEGRRGGGRGGLPTTDSDINLDTRNESD